MVMDTGPIVERDKGWETKVTQPQLVIVDGCLRGEKVEGTVYSSSK